MARAISSFVVLGLLLVAPFVARAQYLVKDIHTLYTTGPSTMAGTADLAWPGDFTTAFNPSQAQATRGAWEILKYLALPNLTLADNNNAVSGTSPECNIYSDFCCADGFAWRSEPCSADDAGGDAECDAFNTGATCEPHDFGFPTQSIRWDDSTDGIFLKKFSTVILMDPGGNSCDNANATVASIITETGNAIDVLLQQTRVDEIILMQSTAATRRVEDLGIQPCADLWDEVCVSCDNTVEDNFTGARNGKVSVYPDMYYEFNDGYPDTDAFWLGDGLHSNSLGYRKQYLPHILKAIGYPEFDNPPPTPQVVVGTVTDTTAEISFSTVVSDPDGDVLTCVVWAVVNGQDLGSYSAGDRIHNGRKVCEGLGGNDCSACGDGSPAPPTPDTDCNVNGTATAADAHLWLTDPGQPIIPDGFMPDYFEVPGCGTGPVTIYGLAASTTYQVGAIAMPDLTVGTTRGIEPSDIDGSETFTTEASP